MADANKVKFGLSNVHYAKATESGGVVTFDTPKAIKGAVNLSLDAQGDETNFYADDSKYYNTFSNTGYSGDLEVAKFPESFYADIFGYTTDTDGNVFEDASAEPAHFALLFEFAGDANKTRRVLYYCTCSRPSVASGTTTETKEPVTESVTITATPLPDDGAGHKYVKAYCVEGDTDYSSWYTAVVTHA